MEQSLIPIEKAYLEGKCQEAYGILQATLNHSMALTIQGYESDILCDLIGTYDAVRETVSKKLNGRFPAELKKSFVDMYSVSVAAQFVADRHDFEIVDTVGSTSMDFATGSRLNHRKVLGEGYKEFLQERSKKGSEAIEHLVSRYSFTARGNAEEQRFDDIKDVMSQYEIEIDGSRYAGFNSGKQSTRVGLESLMSAESVVGNEEFKDVLRIALCYIADFGKEKRLGDLTEVATNLSAFGSPGTGKTSTIKEMCAWANRELAPNMALPLELRIFSNAQKSKYYSESGKEVDKIFNEIEKGSAAYVLVIEDIDKVFMGNSSSDSGTEERAILERLMDRLEGLQKKNLGNYILITTSNNPTDVNSALDGRISHDAVYVPGPQTPIQCGLILEGKLSKAREYLAINSFEELGKRMFSYGFVGRDIRNIARKLYSTFVREIAPTGKVTHEDLEAAIENGYCITAEMAMQAIDETYIKKMQKQEHQREGRINRLSNDLEESIEANSRVLKKFLNISIEDARIITLRQRGMLPSDGHIQ